VPWTPAQQALFRAAAHNPAIAQAHHMSQPKASKLASEGTRRTPQPPPQAYARALAKK